MIEHHMYTIMMCIMVVTSCDSDLMNIISIRTHCYTLCVKIIFQGRSLRSSFDYLNACLYPGSSLNPGKNLHPNTGLHPVVVF